MAAIVRMFNPARRRGKRVRGNPSQLLIVNGGRKVATKRRRTRRRVTAVANTRRRRTVNPRRRHHYFASNRPRRRVNRVHHRRRNPIVRVHRRRHTRRHNPAIKGILQTAIPVAAGVVLTDIATNFLQGFVPAGLLGGPWGAIGVRLGASYLLGMVGERFVTAQTANLMAAGGAAGAIQDAFRLLMAQVGGFLAPAQPVVVGGVAPQPMAGGMSDVVLVPDNWGSMGDVVLAPNDARMYS